MGKRPEPPKESSAPAYFVQYAALWCLMLAFFITLLTLGSQKSAKFKVGMGLLRDAFGLKGGLGLLPYWRKLTSGSGDNNPAVQKVKPEDAGDVVSYFKGMLWKEGLSSVSILHTEADDRGISIYVEAPLQFATNSATLDRDTRGFLSRIGTLFYNLPNTVITVNCLVTNSASDNANLLLAAERVSAISRYLQEQCQIPRRQLDAVAYSHDRYLGQLKWTNENRSILFSIRKLNEKKNKPASTQSVL
ncbi:MAG: flagellar motor protein MotB [Lentisphaerota bacterium]